MLADIVYYIIHHVHLKLFYLTIPVFVIRLVYYIRTLSLIFDKDVV